MKRYLIAFFLLGVNASFAKSLDLKNTGGLHLCLIKITEKDITLNMRRLDNYHNYVALQDFYNTTEDLTDKVNYYADMITVMRRDGACE